VWQVCHLSGLAAGAVTEVWGLAARTAGVPMKAAVSTKLVLGAAHLMAVAVVVPSVAYRLAQVTADPAA